MEADLSVAGPSVHVEAPTPRPKMSKVKSGKRKVEENEGDGDLEVAGKYKKKTIARSCSQCSSRKIKCNRATPCDHCTKRGQPESCQPAERAAVFDPSLLNDMAEELRETKDRLAAVELYLQSLQSTPTTSPSFIPAPYPRLASLPATLPITTRSSERLRDQEETFSDVEDAAVDLEIGMFAPALVTENKPIRSELTKGGTSILKPRMLDSSASYAGSGSSYLGLDFSASKEEIIFAKNAALGRILRLLSNRPLVLSLVDKYFGLDQLFSTLHETSFRAELQFFFDLSMARRDELDPGWISMLCMVLCLALNSSDPVPQTNNLMLSPEKLFHAAKLGLELADWQSTPKIRSIQTIILITQFLQLSANERNGPPTARLVWLASAIRLAFSFNLHRLGSNPATMPIDDPAWPTGKNSLKRESAKRIFSILVYQDWMNASSTRGSLIDPLQIDTDAPSNVEDDELSPIDWRLMTPPSEGRLKLTASTADIIRLMLAKQVRATFDAFRKDTGYETVLRIDEGYREILRKLPIEFVSETTDSISVHFIFEGLNNRILRLHRPWLTRGYKSPKYRYSTDVCVQAARSVIISSHKIIDAIRCVWYCYSHIMGAALVLFCDLFEAIDSHTLTLSDLDSRKNVLDLACEIFSRYDQISSPPLHSAVHHGHKTLTAILFAADKRRNDQAAALLLSARDGNYLDVEETFAQILSRISRSLNSEEARHQGTPPSTRALPSISNNIEPTADDLSLQFYLDLMTESSTISPTAFVTGEEDSGRWDSGLFELEGLGW